MSNNLLYDILKNWDRKPFTRNIVTFLLFGFFIYFISKFRSDCPQTFDEVYRPMDINGIVESKYYDSTNHSIGTIYIISKGYKQYMTLTGQDTIDIYHFVEPKDSIIKPQGSLTFQIIRKKQNIVVMDTIFELLCKYQFISRWNNLW